MKFGFYPKLAASSILKNKRLYLPYLLTCIGMIIIFYIIMYLAMCSTITSISGGETLQSIFGLGSWIIAIFACIFLFYTNSFLTKHRKKEFGLYNILGMNKHNIGRILFWEALITALFSLSIGLICAIIFSKLAEIGLIYIMHGTVTYNLSVSLLAVKRTLQVFGVIFLLLLIHSIWQVRFSSAISLIRSKNTGEKPPKGNWLLGVLGILILAVAYYLAVTIQDPLVALSTFFIAVIMVIVGTYLIMIAGSVFLCRTLQKNKRYYYKPNHFISVSSMAYRMKRNGASLASICVLNTMILVMLASTTCLYFGTENGIRERYPREINMEFDLASVSDLSNDKIKTLKNGISEELAARHVTPTNEYAYRCAAILGILQEDTVLSDPNLFMAVEPESRLFFFVPLADYNAVTGANETLAQGEALVYTNRKAYEYDTISFQHGATFKIKKRIDDFIIPGTSAVNILSSFIIIVPDLEAGITGLDSLADYNGDRLLMFSYIYYFDTGMEQEQQIALFHDLYNVVIDASTKEQWGYETITFDSRELSRYDFYSLYGGLFYLGILLSIVFILATILIIYYKQISEGYEDQARFEIMQKIGMTRQEISKSIHSQLLTVFFLPLFLAILHLAFAFPIIRKLLLIFNLTNVNLFILTTGISIVIFAVFYSIVYRLTSNAYYNIVSGARDNL